MDVARDPLAQSLSLASGEELPNRLCKAALAEGLADTANNPGPTLCQLYQNWAKGGAGLLISGNVHVDRRFQERPTSMVLDERSDLPAFARLAQAGRSGGAGFWLQLNHAGRQCPKSIHPQPLGPSDNAPPFILGGYSRSKAATTAQIEAIIDQFATAARLAKVAGFTGVQVHAAHGYFISSFLSPRLNRRDDQWGGDSARRMAVLLAVLGAVRHAVGPDFTVAIKLNATDFERDGLREDGSLEVARAAFAAGADCIEVSGGTYERLFLANEHPGAELARRWRQTEAFFIDYAARLRLLNLGPVMLTGGFRTGAIMRAAIAGGQTDLIGIGRPFCLDPDFATQVLTGREGAAAGYCAPTIGSGLFGPASIWQGGRRLNALAAQAWFSERMIQVLDRGSAWRAENLSALQALRALLKRDANARNSRQNTRNHA